MAKNLKYVFGEVENIVGKGENAGYLHFLLFPQCFQKVSFSGLLKPGPCVKELKHCHARQICYLAVIYLTAKMLPLYLFENNFIFSKFWLSCKRTVVQRGYAIQSKRYEFLFLASKILFF